MRIIELTSRDEKELRSVSTIDGNECRVEMGDKKYEINIDSISYIECESNYSIVALNSGDKLAVKEPFDQIMKLISKVPGSNYLFD